MYTMAEDRQEGLVLWSFSGTISDDDWTHHFDDIRAMKMWSRALSKRVAVLLVLDDAERPNPLRRQTIADLTDSPSYDPYLALISANPLIRGALRAIRWMTPKAYYDESAHATISSGLDWLEQKRGERLPGFTALLRQVAQSSRGRVLRSYS